MIYISGVGSRQTPKNICSEMTVIGAWCKERGFIVRSGHAEGADWAFELGAQEYCEAYIPWASFNAHLISNAKKLIIPAESPYVELVNKYHPAPHKLSRSALALMCRNSCQVLGEDLKTKSSAVVCWTEDYKKPSGGTSQAIRIAKDYGVPVLNMSDPNFKTAEDVVAVLKTIISV